MMNITKVKTKKGYTLVELVITIAILSIVAGMGIGIFSAVLTHYAAASSVEKEQEEANLLEQEILNSARVAKEVYMIPSTDTAALTDGLGSDGYPRNAFLGVYFANAAGTETLDQFTYSDEAGTGTPTISDRIGHSDVKKITFKFVLQESPSGSDEDGFIFLDYKIEMKEGYVLDGSAVLNNVKLTGQTRTKIMVGTTESAEYTVCGGVGNTAIVFATE